MGSYKFRISGKDTTQELVKEYIDKYIGDSLIGVYEDFSGPIKEADGMIVYGSLINSNSSLDTVRKNFANAFDKYGYISSVNEI
jgi:hypothetical protein